MIRVCAISLCYLACFFLYSKCRRGEKISGTSLSAQFDECVSILLRPEEISRICDSADGREISASQCDKFVRESLPKKATGNFLSSYGPVLFFRALVVIVFIAIRCNPSECRKTKTIVITLANHKGHRQSNEPIKTRRRNI